MSYTIDVRPDAPIIILTQQPGSDVLGDMRHGVAKLIRVLDAQPGPVFMIFDLTDVYMDLDDHLRAAELSTRGENPLLRHPKIRENLYIITDPMMRVATRALGTATYGMVKLSHYETLDQALDYCYGKLGQVRDAADDDQAKAG